MPRAIPIEPLSLDISLRQVIFEDFKSIGRELPISGGWGYTHNDAIVLEPDHSFMPDHNYVNLEYLIVEKRIFEELIICRYPEDRFSGIEWKLQKQTLKFVLDRNFDHLVFRVTAFRDFDFTG